MIRWLIDRVVHFGPGDFIKDGISHFGFHDRGGHYYGIEHQKHFLSAVDVDGTLIWTLAEKQVFTGVPNIEAELSFPMYVDSLIDGSLIVSNFGNARLYHVDVRAMRADLLINGSDIVMADMGNCIVDSVGYIWVNEVTGCRVWRFDSQGHPMLSIGDGQAGFQTGTTDFGHARFSWIYDMRLGPDGNIYVLDSRNYAVRMIDSIEGTVTTLAGSGTAGYTGDGGEARLATFGGDAKACFDGPISLSLDENGNIFVGDRFNHVVRMITRTNGIISTIAGHFAVGADEPTDPSVRDPLQASLPQISSMNYHNGLLYVPTDLTSESGDLVILKKIEDDRTRVFSDIVE